MKNKRKATLVYTTEEICNIINKTFKLEAKDQVFPFTIVSWKKQGIFLRRGKKGKRIYINKELVILLNLAYLIKVLKFEIKQIKKDGTDWYFR